MGIKSWGYWLGFDVMKQWRKAIEYHSQLSKRHLPTHKNFLENYNRKSDTLFILGNGYSITELKESDWDSVKQNDSTGVNGSIYHPFVPDFYMYEPAVTERQHDFFLQTMEKRRGEYQHVPMLIHYPHSIARKRDFSSLKSWAPIFYNVPVQVNTPNLGILKRSIRWFLSSKNTEYYQMHHAASISYIAMMGALMGFKNIVFLGVDLNDSRYFFHAEDLTKLEEEYRPIHDEIVNDIQKRSSSSVHPTADKKSVGKYGCIPIVDYFKVLKEEFIKKGIELYTGNPKSRLTEVMDVWKFS